MVTWFVSLRIYTECGKIRTRKNSAFGHFSHRGGDCLFAHSRKYVFFDIKLKLQALKDLHLILIQKEGTTPKLLILKVTQLVAEVFKQLIAEMHKYQIQVSPINRFDLTPPPLVFSCHNSEHVSPQKSSPQSYPNATSFIHELVKDLCAKCPN